MIKTAALSMTLVMLATSHQSLYAQPRIQASADSLQLPKGAASANRQGTQLVEIDFVDVFSYDLQGAIPPNATLDVNLAKALGQTAGAYEVLGVGWEITIDAFGPSWLSDVSISFGNDSTYQNPAFVLVPGLGDDFFDLRTYESGGIRDLTNWNGTGTDFSFQSDTGIVHLEFFETYDDFIGFPDAWFRNPSTVTLEVLRVPEPGFVGWLLAASLTFVRLNRST